MFFRQWRWLALPAGFAAGWFYSRFFGCASSCGILSNQWMSGVLGALMLRVLLPEARTSGDDAREDGVQPGSGE